MLARVANARRTLDVDLYRDGYDKDTALADLRRLATVDLGDHFRFVYREHHEILTDAIQPYADGYRVTFDAYRGVKLVDTIKVDLSAGAMATGDPQVEDPANRLNLPRLTSYPYRLYPVANQIADKVCATIADYNGRPSSREKDLVDLVVIAATQRVEVAPLRRAIRVECARRGLLVPQRFAIPSTWGPAYARLSRGTPVEPFSITVALEVLHDLIDSAIAGTATGSWDPSQRQWS